MEYALAGEVLASRVERMDRLFKDAKRLGFKEIWLTDGYKGLWRWPVE